MYCIVLHLLLLFCILLFLMYCTVLYYTVLSCTVFVSLSRTLLHRTPSPPSTEDQVPCTRSTNKKMMRVRTILC